LLPNHFNPLGPRSRQLWPNFWPFVTKFESEASVHI
jgi:hypothetical protein